MKNLISFWLNSCQSGEGYDLLRCYGYEHDQFNHGDIGGAKVKTADSFFEYDNSGEFMILQAVWEDQPARGNEVRHPIIYDIIAWHPRSPRKWFFLRGEPCLILGERAYFDATIHHEPLLLKPHPLAWLKSGCEGAVLLDHHGLNRLYGLKKVICANEAHSHRVRKGLQQYYLLNTPDVYIQPSEGL